MEIKIANTKQEVIDHFFVRGEVFIQEQNVDWSIEFDGLDKESILINAYLDSKIVGAARLHGHKIGRLAVLKPYRHQKIGESIMHEVERVAVSNGIYEVYLNAQVYVKDFYEKLGYREQGSIFQEANIDHIRMTKDIHQLVYEIREI